MGGSQSNYAVQGGCKVHQWPKLHDEPITSVFSMSPGVCLASSKDHTFSQFNFKSGTLDQQWRGHAAEVTKVVYGHQASLYFSASRDKLIKTWRRGSPAAVSSLSGHSLVVTALALNQDNTRLVSGSRDNSLILWDVQKGSALLQNNISRNLVTHVHWAPHSNIIAQTGEDKELRVWDSRSLQVSQSFPRKQHIQVCCDISEDENYCLTCSNGFSGNGCEATLWDLRTSKIIREYRGHHETVGGCAFVPSSLSHGKNLIATCSSDCSVRIWDQDSAECVAMDTVPGSGPLTSMTFFTDSCLCVGSFNVGVSAFRLSHDNNRVNLVHASSF